MEPTAYTQVAGMVAGLGVLGVVVAALNLVALRVMRVDEVPSCVRSRIRWWGAHNSAFLVISAVVTAAGVAGLVTA